MISPDIFKEIRDSYGHYASWAVWAEEGQKPKENIDDLSVLDPQINPALLNTLHGNFVFLGLNISRRIKKPFGNFHDPRPMATDFKIRNALKGTCYWGAYMTDIIKDFEEKTSDKLMKYLHTDKRFEEENIQILKTEIEVLRLSSPTLIAFGRDAEKIARRNLSKEFRIIGIPHYANYISKDNYRIVVNNILAQNNAEQGTQDQPLRGGLAAALGLLRGA